MSLSLRKEARHVYVASDATGMHKIGVTGNLKLRAYHLGRERGRPVSIVHSEFIEQAEAIEVTAHMLMVDKHERGEWFEVTEAEALAAFIRAKEKVAAGERPEVRLSMLRSRTLGVAMERRMKLAYGPRESRTDFLRVAVEAELKRRERRKP